MPPEVPYDATSVRAGLAAVAERVADEAGIAFPPEGLEVEESINKRGHKTCEARMTFVGPLQLARAQRQRIRFDLTSDELIVGPPEGREVFHGFSDAPDAAPRIRCYGLGEILAEKVRALFERSGSARDVYDDVNVGRNLRADLSPDAIRGLAERKFAFKSLDPPTPDRILARIDADVLASDWGNTLRHQLPTLPSSGEFLSGLREVLEWLLGAAPRRPEPSPVPARKGEAAVPPLRLARPVGGGRLGRGAAVGAGPWPVQAFGSRMDRVRYAARNRLLARVTYDGVSRLVELYSLRMPKTGNLLLYVFEVERGGAAGGGIKAREVTELGDVQVMDRPFRPRYLVEM